MVLMRNNVTKESTYGWYPPSQDIYQNPRAKHGYGKVNPVTIRFVVLKIAYIRPIPLKYIQM